MAKDMKDHVASVNILFWAFWAQRYLNFKFKVQINPDAKPEIIV